MSKTDSTDLLHFYERASGWDHGEGEGCDQELGQPDALR